MGQSISPSGSVPCWTGTGRRGGSGGYPVRMRCQRSVWRLVRSRPRCSCWRCWLSCFPSCFAVHFPAHTQRTRARTCVHAHARHLFATDFSCPFVCPSCVCVCLARRLKSDASASRHSLFFLVQLLPFYSCAFLLIFFWIEMLLCSLPSAASFVLGNLLLVRTHARTRGMVEKRRRRRVATRSDGVHRLPSHGFAGVCSSIAGVCSSSRYGGGNTTNDL